MCMIYLNHFFFISQCHYRNEKLICIFKIHLFFIIPWHHQNDFAHLHFSLTGNENRIKNKWNSNFKWNLNYFQMVFSMQISIKHFFSERLWNGKWKANEKWMVRIEINFKWKVNGFHFHKGRIRRADSPLLGFQLNLLFNLLTCLF